MPRKPKIHTYTAKDGAITYWISFRWGGKRLHESFPSLELAEKRVHEIVFQRSINAAPVEERGKQVTLSQFIVSEWWPRHAKRRLKPGYRDNCRIVLNRWVGPSTDHELDFCLGNFTLSEINEDVIDRWVEWMQDQGATPSTLTRTMNIVSGIIEKSIRWRMRDPDQGNPLRTTERFEYSSDPPDQALSAEDIYKLKKAMPSDQDSLFVSILAFCGARQQEAQVLRFSDLIDTDGQVKKHLWIRRSLSGKEVLDYAKSAAGRRRIRIPEPVREEITTYFAAKGNPSLDTLVFRNSEGGMIDRHNWQTRVFTPATQRTGLAEKAKKFGYKKITGHDCRDTFAALLAYGDVPIHVISRSLGHSSQRVTERYYMAIIQDIDEDPTVISVDDAIKNARLKVLKR